MIVVRTSSGHSPASYISLHKVSNPLLTSIFQELCWNVIRHWCFPILQLFYGLLNFPFQHWWSQAFLTHFVFIFHRDIYWFVCPVIKLFNMLYPSFPYIVIYFVFLLFNFPQIIFSISVITLLILLLWLTFFTFWCIKSDLPLVSNFSIFWHFSLAASVSRLSSLSTAVAHPVCWHFPILYLGLLYFARQQLFLL